MFCENYIVNKWNTCLFSAIMNTNGSKNESSSCSNSHCYPLISVAGRPFHPTVAYTLFNASYVKNDPNESNLRNVPSPELSAAWRRRRKVRKPGVTAPPSRPKMDMKKHVSWFEGSRMYAFRASPDTRLLIRHAPIPAAGSPWPLPQHYYPEDAVFTLKVTCGPVYMDLTKTTHGLCPWQMSRFVCWDLSKMRY